MNRRRFLRSVSLCSGIGLLAGCPEQNASPAETPDGGAPPETEGKSTPSPNPETETAEPTPRSPTPTPTRSPTPTPDLDIPEAYRKRFDRVVNVGTHGADPGKSGPLNPVLDEFAADHTLLFLPEGRYRMDGHWSYDGFTNFGIYGPGATIVPPKGYAGYLFVVGEPGNSEQFLMDGLSFDISTANTGPRALYATVTDGLLVRDISVNGVQDTDQGVTRFDITDPDGRGRVTRMRIPDGGAPGTLSTGCLVGPRSEGELTLTDCHIARFPDNGLYGSPAPGAVNVHGGYYANNGISNVRVSGESEVRGVHVVCDEARKGVPNMRGIRLRDGEGALIEDCRIELREVTMSDGAIALSEGMGAATVRDTAIRVDTDNVPAIRAKPPSDVPELEHRNPRLRCLNVSILGDAAGGRAIHVVGRDRSVFENLCVEQKGKNRHGFYFVDSRGSTVTNSEINVTGDPIVTSNSTLTTSDLITGGEVSCSSQSN